MSLRFLAFLFAAAASAVPVSAAARSFMFTDFTKIRIDGP
jgi:hypothetical protein